MAEPRETSTTSMPPVLEDLVVRTALATGVTPSSSSSPPPPPPLPDPVATAQLLKRVDDLYAAYVRVVELTCHSLQAEAAVAASSDSIKRRQQRQQSEALAAAMADATASYERCAAELQAGIRSKVSQTTRIALVHHLRAEVMQRRAAVERMESTLAVAQKYL